MTPDSFKSTGVTLPYEKQAMSGDDMPTGLEYPDQIMFLQLRMLYDQFRKGIIDKQTAQAEKRHLLDTYETHKRNWKMCDEWCAIIRLTELVRAEYRKNRTLEIADRLCDIIEGRKPA